MMQGGKKMKILFKDDLFDAQLLRALNAAYYGGADIGECITTARTITEGSAESWYRAWMECGERINAAGEASLAAGHLVSAREAFLRASTYFRTAYIFLFGAPVDARVVKAYDMQTTAFRKAAALFSPAAEIVAIHYEGMTLPAYFLRAEKSNEPRPTLILVNGYDGTAEEVYFYNGAAALRRGYNCLIFDGPGQGGALIKQGLVFRPDWDKVTTPAVDYLLTRTDVDPHQIAIMGLSFGGFLATRAASGEHRLAACIADPGQDDLFTSVKGRIPGFLAHQLPNGNPVALELLRISLDQTLHHLTGGWGLRRGMWTHGVSTPLAYIETTQQYTMHGFAKEIQCPTLICCADNDEASLNAKPLYDAMQCPKQFIIFTAAEGAGEHCEAGARSLFHQRAFDWLDNVLQAQHAPALAVHALA
jgi:pimeloyl-ACP methyl ester carboxylesterase